MLHRDILRSGGTWMVSACGAAVASTGRRSARLRAPGRPARERRRRPGQRRRRRRRLRSLPRRGAASSGAGTGPTCRGWEGRKWTTRTGRRRLPDRVGRAGGAARAATAARAARAVATAGATAKKKPDETKICAPECCSKPIGPWKVGGSTHCTFLVLWFLVLVPFSGSLFSFADSLLTLLLVLPAPS